MANQDILQRAKERYSDAVDASREQDERIREDLRFSNPANPEQWDPVAVTARKGRPMLVLDRTNQFISQIVNDARQNKPSIQVLPADSNADIAVAQQLNGVIRHIEYVSRAGIAYDTAIELSARVGIGYLRVTPKIIRPETNEQEIVVQRVHDPLACRLDTNSIEPDGSDAMWGFHESTITTKAFERMFPNAKKDTWDSSGWWGEDSVRVAEYFEVVEEKESRIAIAGPDGGRMVVSEAEYWQTARQIGFNPQVTDTFTAVNRVVKWYKLSGCEVLEGTVFPSKWVPLIPVLGYELWVDGKRYLCGMVRRLMDGQRFHNYEMSALAEVTMSQPKAPFLLSSRAMEGHEEEWQKLNSGNPSALTYEDMDESGQPIAPPIRLSPPSFPAAYANGAQLGVSAMEAAVGMYKSNLGQQSNAVSGRAKLADQREGDTANFHYIDNLRRSMEHMGRIIVDMIPKIYDTERQAKILGEDGEQSSIMISPEMPMAAAKRGNKVIAINPSIGAYDVRVKIGPSYTSMRTEASQRLVEISQGNPALGAALAPLLVKLNDMPEADKIAKVAIALLPPNVQQVYSEEEADDIPAAVKAQMQQMQYQIKQMSQAMDQAGSVIQDLQGKLADKSNAVQDHAKMAMSEIKAAQADLSKQAADLDAAKRELMQAQKIASLELQLEAERNAADEAAMREAETQDPEDNSKEAMNALAEVVRQSQQAMVDAIQQNTAAVAQLQSLTVDAIEDMADAMSAPRQINVHRGPDGRAIGATSMLTMKEKEESANDE